MDRIELQVELLRVQRLIEIAIDQVHVKSGCPSFFLFAKTRSGLKCHVHVYEQVGRYRGDRIPKRRLVVASLLKRRIWSGFRG
jgi:hypothetical protein